MWVSLLVSKVGNKSWLDMIGERVVKYGNCFTLSLLIVLPKFILVLVHCTEFVSNGWSFRFCFGASDYAELICRNK